MLTSIRRPVTLSMVSMVLALAGCTDPRGRYDDYASMFHIPDAGPMGDAPMTGGLADITGTFLLSITTPIALPPLQTLVTIVLDQTTTPPKVNLHIQYLKDADRTLIAEGQTDYNNLEVDPDTGTFIVNVGDLVIPAAATSLNSPLTVSGVVITSTIQSTDFFCGSLTGNALGTDLTGSTFGAVRVQVGQTGSALPGPALSCADQPSSVDAGTSAVDAGSSTPDAP